MPCDNSRNQFIWAGLFAMEGSNIFFSVEVVALLEYLMHIETGAEVFDSISWSKEEAEKVMKFSNLGKGFKRGRSQLTSSVHHEEDSIVLVLGLKCLSNLSRDSFQISMLEAERFLHPGVFRLLDLLLGLQIHFLFFIRL